MTPQLPSLGASPRGSAATPGTVPAGRGHLLDLFDGAAAQPAAELPAAAPRTLPARAVARLVETSRPDMLDPRRRSVAILVVACPFCAPHIHPGGHIGAVQLGERRSRCVGRPAGTYTIELVSA